MNGVKLNNICPKCSGTKKHVVQTIKLKGRLIKVIEACPYCQGTGENT